jgi:hypothetical protein
MRRPNIAILTAAAVCAGGTLASAQTASPNAARAATQAAQAVTRQIEQRHHSGMSGTVQLHSMGVNRTEVLVSLHSMVREKPMVTLHRGSDCQDGRFATQADVVLAPMNATSENAQQSRAVINLPIQKVSSDYVIDVRNATQSAQFAEACARLRR